MSDEYRCASCWKTFPVGSVGMSLVVGSCVDNKKIVVNFW